MHLPTAVEIISKGLMKTDLVLVLEDHGTLIIVVCTAELVGAQALLAFAEEMQSMTPSGVSTAVEIVDQQTYQAACTCRALRGSAEAIEFVRASQCLALPPRRGSLTT